LAIETVVGTCQSVLKRPLDYDDLSVCPRDMSGE